MNLEKLGQWVGVLANVGVFAGFLGVAYQLHQNAISLQSNSVYASNQLFASSDSSMMGDTTYAAFAHSLLDPASLSPEELTQMWGYMSVTLYSTHLAFADYQRGLISEDQWQAVSGSFVSYINHPVGRILWKTQLAAADPDTNTPFFDAIQERFESAPPNATQHWFRAMLEEIRTLPAEPAADPTAGSASSTSS